VDEALAIPGYIMVQLKSLVYAAAEKPNLIAFCVLFPYTNKVPPLISSNEGVLVFVIILTDARVPAETEYTGVRPVPDEPDVPEEPDEPEVPELPEEPEVPELPEEPEVPELPEEPEVPAPPPVAFTT